jgi:hypothetical protein
MIDERGDLLSTWVALLVSVQGALSAKVMTMLPNRMSLLAIRIALPLTEVTLPATGTAPPATRMAHVRSEMCTLPNNLPKIDLFQNH